MEQRAPVTRSAFRRELEPDAFLLGAIVESCEDSIITVTPDGIIITWNKAAEEIYGYSAEEAVGRPLAMLSIPGAESLQQKINEVMAAHRVKRFEVERERKDGARIFLSIQMSPVKNTAGDIIAISTISRDITARRQAEESLDQTRKLLAEHAKRLERTVAERTRQLEGSIKAMETFCYSIAHNLRAPLRGMRGFALALQEDYNSRLDETARDYCRRINAAAQRMDKLIDGLLAYGKLAQLQLPQRGVDLNRAVEKALKLFAPDMEKHECHVEIHQPLPAVCADEEVLSLMLEHLISNALKFVPRDRQPWLRIRGEYRQDKVRLWIEDNGIGIAPEHRAQLFDPFARLHLDEAYGGTGIGLALVQKGTEQMGGAVGVESIPGEGSQFWIELPLAPQCSA